MSPDAAPPQYTKIQDCLATFRPTKLFHSSSAGPAAYTSIDFDDSGELLLLSRTDDTIQLFNVKAGAHAKELKSQKYGSALARFTHHSPSIIYASTKVDDDIRYLSMHDNIFIRYFRGHNARVTNNTVKLWDIRTPNATWELRFVDPWLTAYDPGATVIAIASPTAQTVLLYDVRNLDKPPFATFDLHDIEKRFVRHDVGWTGLEFSNTGKFILISTNGPGHYLIDAFNGELVHYLHRPSGSNNHLAPGDTLPDPSTPYNQADACLTPDGRYVISCNGSQNELVYFDSTEKGRSDGVLDPSGDLPSTKPAAVVAYNPRHNLIASAEREVILWLPDMDLT